ncbi:MAG: hypothetical protein A2487_02790 [Candidatus Raymondbacteria bacterium RifOxyC12_full_50_8]|uniref:Uncharacterized protein n=1 Tax=Candidatus Raymondbacteria bacterium RIFOXYD12_FULL_49_13 TaxID=1817890 RepID=A0A1F7F6T7_UNCRA|nr:MAG: hypothetical protein A2350_07000 [Candidatus Raymondbacteria bacterium RifOxyB12_full_50_8]OGJ93180.1 MAG: hypothetical protein A2248_17565 [Candidatus Raymondbacteria bacterium RIFOXYA2_FULL_49_16]OGJ93370.1 MAG: hypothetical protein A2487_02790 [Candidatus Raymondbacteria bacterium RifOxyC12_full_50_8]OGK02288.1 MAG: hypothetical protein A2519_16585 [Candidatus Raymondbacteria bacterium RIFOXYD12_FULL_49_13]OGP44902.1 MAG: hypothetical protein A2324_19490 [Candidatus Raymondbacteria b
MSGRKGVLLIRSETPVNVKFSYIPNSLLVLAEALLKHGYQPSIIDMKVQDWRAALNAIDIDLLLYAGIGTLTGPQIQYGLEIARALREKRSDLPIIWGGVHPSLLPEETVAHDLCDAVVRGEAEETVVELAQRIEAGESYYNVRGCTFKLEGKIVSTPDRDWTDLDAIGLLPYHLLDMKKYDIDSYFTYHSSRGCPHNCGFCINLAYNKKTFRAQSAEKIVNNIEHILRPYGVKTIYFTDDNFLVNRQRIETMARLIIERGLKFDWIASCRFDYFVKYDARFLSLLKESGCVRLGYGAESGSRRILEYIDKGITPDQVLSSVQKARDAGIKMMPVSFMYGFPGETRDDLLASLDLIDKIRETTGANTVINGIFLMTPYPGIPLSDELKKMGFQFPSSFEAWGRYTMGEVVDKRIFWLDRDYLIEAFCAANIARFHFFVQIGAGKRLKSPLLRLLYRLFILPFLLSEKLRWKRRYFKHPYEWYLWSFIRNTYLQGT